MADYVLTTCCYSDQKWFVFPSIALLGMVGVKMMSVGRITPRLMIGR
jgi:hypothetical protein